MKTIHKIVVTGGPCGGKSTGMSWIQNAFAQRGYAVLFISETATELIQGGVAPWTCASNLDYQMGQMSLQVTKEKIFEQAAAGMKAEKILIVCDRGALDNKVYMTEAEFAEVLRRMGLNEIELRDGYDAIFHLVTAAKGAVAFYTTANNQARTETPQEAAALDDRLIAAWSGHPHLRVIGNESGFEEKMMHLIREISSFLGEPMPYEIERKFLIEYPDPQMLLARPACKKVEIIQTYLKSTEDEEVRIRQRGAAGSYVYYETRKKTVGGARRIETERRLSREEYLTLLMQADPMKRPIRKDRYCLMEDDQYFEIDLYPFWKDRAICEIELTEETQEIRIPAFLKVIREVTTDPEYKNAALADLKGIL